LLRVPVCAANNLFQDIVTILLSVFEVPTILL
jgi:hypothetical protein